MDDSDKNPSQEPKSDKKLRLDLREAWIEEPDDDDDIIELKDEVKLPPKPKEAKIDRKDQMTAGRPSDEPVSEKIIALDALGEETDDQKSVIRLADDLAFEEEDRDETQIPSPVGEQILKPDTAGEVVEITEFDDVLSEDDELPTLSDLAEELEPEEEFLELIDVEEDDQIEENDLSAAAKDTERKDIEDEIIQFEGPAEDAEDVELEDFINDSLGEEIRINDDFEDELTNALDIEAASETKMADGSSEAEDFDFSMDSREISEKIEQLDTIFFDDSESEDEFDEDAELEAGEIEAAFSYSGNENVNEEQEAGDLELYEEPVKDVLPAASPDDEFEEDGELEPEEIEAAVSYSDNENVNEEQVAADLELYEEPVKDVLPAASPDDEFDEDGELEPEEIEAAVSYSGNENVNEEQVAADLEISEEPVQDALPAAKVDISQDQIDQSIERIITQNFSDKIEFMIREIIEKSVSQEINRLKTILLENSDEKNL